MVNRRNIEKQQKTELQDLHRCDKSNVALKRNTENNLINTDDNEIVEHDDFMDGNNVFEDILKDDGEFGLPSLNAESLIIINHAHRCIHARILLCILLLICPG